MHKIYKVNKEYTDSRLDRWFKRNVCDVPQSLIEKSIRKGVIKVNNKKEKSLYKLKENDKIDIKNFYFKPQIKKKTKTIYIPTKKDLSSSSNIFIEDNENFSVINKPSGISVQSGTKSKRNIIDILKETKEFNGFRPYTVHRLDKETTGILIVAKNRKFAQLFTSLFRIRKIHKTYLGIVVGDFEKKKGTFIDNLLYYEGTKKNILKAVTHFTLLNSNNNYSFLKLNPETGRKHQLRKQLLLRGHPILGDTKYRLDSTKTSKKNSLMLHAYKINFSIADIKYSFKAEPPKNFKTILEEKYLKTFLK